MTATASNGNPVCEIPGCSARVHGKGRCRVHYDSRRYLETTGQTPEALEAARREQAIRAELSLGCVSEWESPFGTNSMFKTKAERRKAWEGRRDELLEEYLTPPRRPGGRPWAWWEFEAGREQHLVPYPPFDFEGSDDELAEALDEYHNEPVIWMAAHGHLTPEEIDRIAEDAEEVRPRIGTDDEHIGSGGVDQVDRRAVKLHEAVMEALRE